MALQLFDFEVMNLSSKNIKKKNMTDEEINMKYERGEQRIVTEQGSVHLDLISTVFSQAKYNLRPEFQRRITWDTKKRSKLIESFIMNIPVPPVFLFEEDYSSYVVMDGLQRISAIMDFYRDVYELNGLEEWSELSNSVVLYNAVIISVYGSFELYIDELLKAYIEYLKNKNLSFKTFPLKLQEKQKDKAAEFLGNPGRFLNYGLSIEQVISNLMDTIINDNSQSVTEKLLISHGGNIKTQQLNNLLADFGISDLSAKLKKHGELKRFSSNNELDGEIIIPDGFPLLDTIVDERNKVAHGWNVDNRISFAMLKQKYLPFFRVFCKALNDIIISTIIKDSRDSGEIIPFDPIIKVWPKGTYVGINNKEFQLNVGDVLFYSTPDDWFYWFEIKSLMNGKEQRHSIRARNKDITIGCDARIHENYQIWGVNKTL